MPLSPSPVAGDNLGVLRLLALIPLLAPVAGGAHHRDQDRYDWEFDRAAQRYNSPEVKRDWRLNKAVCQVESGLREHVVSPAGAQGICQFMPATYRSWGDPGTTPFDAKSAIKASARYLRWQWNNWSGRPRTATCQWELALAGYNGGIRSVLRAQYLSEDALCWGEIKGKLREVTGRHSVETINYIDRNEAAYRNLGGERLWRVRAPAAD